MWYGETFYLNIQENRLKQKLKKTSCSYYLLKDLLSWRAVWQRGRDNQKFSIDWLTPQIPTIARAGSDWIQEPGIPSRSAKWMSGTQVPRPLSAVYEVPRWNAASEAGTDQSPGTPVCKKNVQVEKFSLLHHNNHSYIYRLSLSYFTKKHAGIPRGNIEKSCHTWPGHFPSSANVLSCTTNKLVRCEE